MPKVKLPKDIKRTFSEKVAANNASSVKKVGGNLNTLTAEHAPKEFKGKGGYHHTQKGKMNAKDHPLLKEFEKKWTCTKCRNVKNVSVLSLDVKFEGGEFGKLYEKWKVTCTCGWRMNCDTVTKPNQPEITE